MKVTKKQVRDARVNLKRGAKKLRSIINRYEAIDDKIGLTDDERNKAADLEDLEREVRHLLTSYDHRLQGE